MPSKFDQRTSTISTISTISGQAAQERTDAWSVATIGTSHCDQACAHDVVRLAVGLRWRNTPVTPSLEQHALQVGGGGNGGGAANSLGKGASWVGAVAARTGGNSCNALPSSSRSG